MLRPEETITTLASGRRAASVVYFIDEAVGEVLLGKHMRGPFMGIIDGFGGKYESEKDRDIRDCSVRETSQELGLEEGIIQKVRLELVGVLVCFNTGTETKHRWVPVYAYRVNSKDEIPFKQQEDGMQDINRFPSSALPSPLKGGTEEMIAHIAGGADDLLFLRSNNEQEGTGNDLRLLFQNVELLKKEKYKDYYREIMA